MHMFIIFFVIESVLTTHHTFTVILLTHRIPKLSKQHLPLLQVWHLCGQGVNEQIETCSEALSISFIVKSLHIHWQPFTRRQDRDTIGLSVCGILCESYCMLISSFQILHAGMTDDVLEMSLLVQCIGGIVHTCLMYLL